MTTKASEIKTMKLYHHVERIERRLKLGGATSPSNASSPTATSDMLDPEQLGTMDCLHYFGDEPIQKMQSLLAELQATTDERMDALRVLDIGTGYGGTARLLAHRTGCHVSALELQPDLSAVAQELTRRCGLSNRVTHLTGDFLQQAPPSDASSAYSGIISLLCFMHIGHWQELFTRCFQSLRPGGVLYVEDFFHRGEQAFSTDEMRVLREDLYCTGQFQRRDALLALVTACGFEVVAFEDMTEKWVPYVTARAESYSSELATHVEEEGAEAAHGLNHFYRCVANVFQSGTLGGYRLVARRPASVSQ